MKTTPPLETVADFLKQCAETCKDALEKDAFARSAFNRYYYSAYWTIREFLLDMDKEKYEKVKHKDIPTYLKKERSKLSKYKSIDPSETSRAQRALTDLANLMEGAYGVRVSADYHPEVRVSASSHLSLGGVKLSEAANWVTKSRHRVHVLKSFFHALGAL